MTSIRNLLRASHCALLLAAAPAHAVVGGVAEDLHDNVVLVYACNDTLQGDCGLCSGVAVSQRHVLTSAHCVPWNFVTGSMAVFRTMDDWLAQRAVAVKAWTSHPSASGQGGVPDHDLAVVELEAPLGGLTPARLSEVALVAPGNLTLVGWGTTSIELQDAARRSGPSSLDSSTPSPPTFGFGATGATPCSMDSGAGLFAGSGAGETLVGIVSTGSNNCTGPGIAVDLVGERAFLEATAPAIYPAKPATSDNGGCGSTGTSAPGALVALLVGLVRRRWPSLGILLPGSPRSPFPSSARFPGSPPVPPRAYTPDAERLLPSLVASWPRTHLNDGFGGLDQGGVHASYDVDGHPVRALVRHASSEAQARAMVEGAPPGQGSAAWSRGRTWWFVSGGTVQGDEDPVFAPGDVEAVERFAAALRQAHGEVA